MEKQIHENFIKSSNLIFITAGLGLINFFFASDLLSNGFNITVAVFSIAFIIGIGFLVRQGYNWMKIFLLVITLLGLVGIPFTLKNLTEKPVVGIINIIQTILQIWAVVLLFKVPKQTEN
jgi:membrane-bound ClpP family serine protease